MNSSQTCKFFVAAILFFFSLPLHASQFEAPVHRLGLFMVGSGGMEGETDGGAIGLGILSYEYISRIGVSLNLTPLSVYEWKGLVETRPPFAPAPSSYRVESTDYIPVWLRKYFRGDPKKNWYFVGIGYCIHKFNQFSYAQYTTDQSGNLIETIIPEKTSKKRSVAYEFGMDFGGRLFNRGNIAMKIIPGSSTENDNTLYLLTYGFSFGWAGGSRSDGRPEK